MSDTTGLWAVRDRHIQQMIDRALERYKPDLAQATGELSTTRYPTPTGNAPGGYTPSLHASSHHSGGDDPLALGSIAGTIDDTQHDNRGGGDLHAAATTSVAGFLSAADKTKLDAMPAYSGLTAGQVLRATGASAASFGALDLADSDGVTGLLSPTNGGTGVNNGSFTLTIPASGTAALRASAATAGRVGFWSDANSISHDAALAWDNSNKRLGVGTSSPSTLFHVLSESAATQQFTGYFDSGSVSMVFQRARGTLASPTTVTNSLTLGSISASGYASTAAAFLRGAVVSFEVDGAPTSAGDIPCRIVFYVHTAGAANDAVTQAMSILNSKTVLIGKTSGLTGAGDLDIAGVIKGDSYIALSEVSAPSAPAANGARLFLQDNGAGKTQFCIIYNTGGVRVLDTQP